MLGWAQCSFYMDVLALRRARDDVARAVGTAASPAVHMAVTLDQ